MNTRDCPENKRVPQMTMDQKEPGLFHMQDSKKQSKSSKRSQKSTMNKHPRETSKECTDKGPEESKEKDIFSKISCDDSYIDDLDSKIDEGPWILIKRQKKVKGNKNKGKREPNSQKPLEKTPKKMKEQVKKVRTGQQFYETKFEISGKCETFFKEEHLTSEISQLGAKGRKIVGKAKTKPSFKVHTRVLLKKTNSVVSKEARDYEKKIKNKNKSKEMQPADQKPIVLINNKKRKQTRRKSRYGKKSMRSNSKRSKTHKNENKTCQMFASSGEVSTISIFVINT